MFSAAAYDAVMALAERRLLGAWRRELLADAAGDVLEIGAGTGANLAWYGPKVRRLLLVEPDAGMRARLVRRAPAVATVLAASARRLPVADASIDTVVSTLVLCSVGNLDTAIGEIARVLRPEGRLLLLEHVAAPAGTVTRAAQHLLTPLWSRMAGGCSLEAETGPALRRHGFDVARLNEDTLPAPVVRAILRGRAAAPGSA